jgi:muramoyltetrapeptide carboxypeptidase
MPAPVIQPVPALKEGDRVRLVAPASPFPRKKFEQGIRVLERMGFVPVFDRSEFAARGYLAGSDRERANRLSAALAEPGTRAVWCIRGGYGTARILPLLDLDSIRKRPKALVGFSDVTALLAEVSRPGGFVGIHGPVLTQLSSVPAPALAWLKGLLTVSRPAGSVPLGRMRSLTRGEARGRLVGGNLATLASLAGTPHLPDAAGCILLLEDTSEQAYRLDRMFNQLAQAGFFRRVSGVVLGSLKDCKPTRGPYAAKTVLARAIEALKVPAVAGASFGHSSRNVALPLGVRASLDATARELILTEPAVR